MSTDDPYTHLEIVRCATCATAAAVCALIGEDFTSDSAIPLSPDTVVGDFSSYLLDGDVAELFANLTALEGDLALRMRTEDETGEPGALFVYAAGTGSFTGRCDRGGTVMVPADALADLTGTADAARRRTLLADLTGSRVLAALTPEPQPSDS